MQNIILRFFTTHFYQRPLGTWCTKGIEESTMGNDYLVSLMHHDPSDLGLTCLVNVNKYIRSYI